VAAVVYQRGAHPINLFTWPATGTRDLDLETISRQGYHLIHWVKDGMVSWLISDLNEGELKDFAEMLKK
jgi:anti-sigma factor RsiW